jgi:hypothetical protein
MEAGEEVVGNYLGNLLLAPLEVRRQELRENWGFVCQCPRCTSESRLNSKLLEMVRGHPTNQPAMQLGTMKTSQAAVWPACRQPNTRLAGCPIQDEQDQAGRLAGRQTGSSLPASQSVRQSVSQVVGRRAK